MNEEEIFSMIVDELTEHALQEQRKQLAEQGRDYNAEF